MGGPAKPPDSSLIAWSHVAGAGDTPLDAIWYTPIVRAINRRLNAINAVPLAEDTSKYWFSGSEDSGSSNETEWGQGALRAGNVQTPYYLGSTSSPLAGPFFLESTLIDAGFPSIITWRPTRTWKTTTASSTSVAAGPISSNEEDASNPIQYPAGGDSGSTNLALQDAGWIPSAGDIVKFRFEAVPVGGAIGTPTHVPYPDDYGLFTPTFLYFGYPQLMAMVINLLCYFVDPSIDWAGKTEPDIQSLCQYHQDWYDHAIFAPQLGPSSTGGKYFYSLQIRPLFQTAYPAWPPKTAPAGWPGTGAFGGFTRIREREITTLSDPGTEGQIARFILSNTGQYEDGQTTFSTDDLSQFYGPSWTKPTSLPHPFTPSSEFKFARAIMLYHSGAWGVHPDPTALPDRLTFYGLPKPGDIFGPWIVNELREAISLLTDWIADETIWYGHTINSSGVTGGDKSAAYGNDSSSYGHTASSAAAVTAYNDSPNPQYGPDPTGMPIVGEGGAYSFTASDIEVSGPGYFCASSSAKLYMYSLAHGQTRDVKFWMCTQPIVFGTAAYSFDNVGLTWATYSSYPSADGSATDYGQICLAGTTTGSTDDHIDLAGYIGSLPQWLPSSFPATPAPLSPPNIQGVHLIPLVATVHVDFVD